MDEELMEIITEENIEVPEAEVVETEVVIEDEEYDISTEETVETVEVEPTEEIEIEIEEAIGWVGGDSERHYSLLGRDDPNQHEIKAITGLREELDEIERLKTVYSDKPNTANYYKWNDGAYDEHGYFVSLTSHSAIKICEGTDIFGVTVDAAAFIGNQDKDVARDNSYALVVTTGLVDVRCESTVTEGDYVISNGHGIAEKTTSNCGYKVIEVSDNRPHDPGVLYATIALGVQACTTDSLGKNLKNLETRVGNNETNIAAAMNTANDAYNKAIESDSVSEEAVLKALEALAQANGAKDATDIMNKVLESTNNTAIQAKAIAEGAVSEADRIRKEAYDTANDALTNVNDLVQKFEPLNEWVDPATGQVGAEYIINYMDNQGLATKAEIQTVESLTEDNKSAIEQNAQNITMMVSSVDKYSVGEYSQAYGLTLEQARSILKEGMIYIPTKHGDISTHTETYSDEVSYSFTYTFYYVWNGDIWSEGIGKVWFGTEQPAGDTYTYWYDGDKLCLLNDGEWTEVATLAGNVNNRITSMIRQDVDEVRAEIVNAYGSVAGFGAKLSDTESVVDSLAAWKNGDGEVGEAIIRQEAKDGAASIVISTLQKNANDEVEASASLVLSAMKNGDGTESFLAIDADRINFGGNGTKEMQFEADNINFGDTVTITSKSDRDVMNVADNFIVDRQGNVRLNGGVVWGTGSSPAQVLYCASGKTKPTNGSAWSSFPSDSKTDWHQTFKSGQDYYGSYTYDGGVTWGNPIQIVGIDGSPATVDDSDVFNILTNNEEMYGCFSDEDNKLYINAQYIKSGTVDADLVLAGNVKAKDIDAEGGTIAGWTIGEKAIYSNGTGMCSDYNNEPSQGLVITNKIVTGIGTCTDVNIIIPNGVTSIGENAFKNCKSITSITLPDSITSIGSSAFYKCASLTSVTIPDSVESIGSQAFIGCKSIRNIIIPDGITSILGNTFNDCGLTSVTIPKSVTSIINYAFRGCSSLKNVYYTGTEEEWAAISIGSYNSPLTNATIHYNYIATNLFPSLVCECENHPRFYAGGYQTDKFGMPTSNSVPNFLVLEDGSLYASGAKINGEMYATNGSFSGEINTPSGNIGGFTINPNNLSTSDEKISITTDGLIVAQKMQIKDSCQFETIKTQKVSGKNSNSPYLLLEATSTNDTSSEVGINTTYIISQQGVTNWLDQITNEGYVAVTIKTENGTVLNTEQTFTITATYKDGDETKSISQTTTLTEGYSSTSVNFPHLVAWSKTVSSGGRSHTFNYVGSFSSVTVSPNKVTIVSYSSAQAISCSANFVPTVKGEGSGASATGLNLGASDCKWNYVYALNNGIGSDRKIKDNIADIDDEFSNQLINGLRAKSYIYNTTTTPRTHYGFIAQEVEELLHSLGTSADEVGIVCKSKPGEPDGEDNHYSLNYINLIAPMVNVIQQLSKRVEELENKLNAQQND